MSVEFLHQVSCVKDLDIYERRREQQRQERMRMQNLWDSVFRVEDIPEVLEFPPSDGNIFSFRPYGTHMSLFNTRIYISHNLRDQIPEALAPRIMSDSVSLAQIPDQAHDQRTELTTRRLCGLWQLSQAMFSWRDMQYRCYGCGRTEVTNGYPTSA